MGLQTNGDAGLSNGDGRVLSRLPAVSLATDSRGENDSEKAPGVPIQMPLYQMLPGEGVRETVSRFPCLHRPRLSQNLHSTRTSPDASQNAPDGQHHQVSTVQKDTFIVRACIPYAATWRANETTLSEPILADYSHVKSPTSCAITLTCLKIVHS